MAILGVFIARSGAAGALPEPYYTGTAVYLDNDTLLFNSRNEDRNYTMGLVFQGSGQWVVENRWAAPLKFVDGLAVLKSVRPAYANQNAASWVGHAFQFGDTAFTPDDLANPAPIPGDRPYANLTFIDVSEQWLSKTGKRAYTTRLSVGVLGTGIGKSFQRWLHRQIQNSDGIPAIPQGWDHQISNGGEPTARYSARWQGLMRSGQNFDIQWIADGNVGYYDNVGGAMSMRLGRLSSPWFRFSPLPIEEHHNLVSSMMVDSGPESQSTGPSDGEAQGTGVGLHDSGRREFYFWGAVTARAWLYNALLQGQFRHSDVTVSASDVKRLWAKYHWV